MYTQGFDKSAAGLKGLIKRGNTYIMPSLGFYRSLSLSPS